MTKRSLIFFVLFERVVLTKKSTLHEGQHIFNRTHVKSDVTILQMMLIEYLPIMYITTRLMLFSKGFPIWLSLDLETFGLIRFLMLTCFN